MLDQVTPILLTFNEEENIGRSLARLRWAARVIIIDSFSDDDTLNIVKGYSNVVVYQREFDNFSSQRQYALKNKIIATEWALYMDADYIMSKELVDEIAHLKPIKTVNAYKINFDYCVYGKKLRACLYPPKLLLFRVNSGIFRQEGHHETLEVSGEIGRLKSKVLHDDRKPLRRWIKEQDKYSSEEANRLKTVKCRELSFADRVRKTRLLGPVFMLIYCWIVKGLFLDGKEGLFYVFQRVLYEIFLSLKLIELDWRHAMKKRD